MAIDPPHLAAPRDRDRRSPITPPDSSHSSADETPAPAPDSSPPTGDSVAGFLETASSVRGAAGFLDGTPASPSRGARAFLTASLASSTSPSALASMDDGFLTATSVSSTAGDPGRFLVSAPPFSISVLFPVRRGPQHGFVLDFLPIPLCRGRLCGSRDPPRPV